MLQSDFREQLELVHKLGLQAAKPIDINLAVVAKDHEYNITGNFLYIKDAPDADVYINVKVNSSDQPAVSWSKQTGFRHPFDRLYITTPAGQTGTMKILIASESPQLFEVIDNRSAVSESTDKILVELRGSIVTGDFRGITVTAAPGATQIIDVNEDRRAGIIQALSTNTGNVFLGFGPTVTVGGAPGEWFAELQPGMSYLTDDYRGKIYGIAAAEQIVGTGEW